MNKDCQEEWSLDPNLTPNALVALLGCQLCPDSPILQIPTTLACGHTVCSNHLDDDDQICPMKDCIPLDLSTKYSNITFTTTCPSPGSMEPIGSDVRLAQIISLALEYEQRQDSSSFSKDLLELLTCEICLNLLEEPTTTPCQHTFCLSCIQRSLDHTPNCPLCRHHFPNISIFNLYQPNAILSSILLSISPTNQITTTSSLDPDHALDTPIFVCQLSFPDMPTILHIFEPRYRLMLRRALKSENKQFGMIMYPAHDGLTINYGTMLRIQSVKILSDGRSVIETWGTHRFRIVNRAEKDGYMVGEVERIDDLPEAMERELERNATLYIPPRTPPVQQLLSPTPGRSPAPSNTELSNSSPRPTGIPLPSLLRRSNSPAPSIASLNSISTLSSTHSVPPSSAPSTSASHSRRSSTRSYGLRRFRTSSSQGTSSSNGTIEAPTTTTEAPTATTSPTSTHPHTPSRPAALAPSPPRMMPGYDYPSEMSTDELVATCLAFIQRLRRGSSPLVIQRLNTVGPVPEDKALLSFWIAQLLPIDESEKSKLLPIRSPRLRLRLVVHWIDQFNAAWWFSGSGCVVA